MQVLVFAIISSLLAAIAYWKGFVSIRQHAWKPSLSTWAIWTVLDVLLILQNYLSGARGILWQLATFLAGALIVTVLAVKFGERKWQPVDTYCTVGAALSVLIWVITGSPQLALVCSVITHFFGAIPTLATAWHRPGDESLTVWSLFLASTYVNLGAIEDWGMSAWASLLWPIYGALWLPFLVFLIAFPRAFGRSANPDKAYLS